MIHPAMKIIFPLALALTLQSAIAANTPPRNETTIVLDENAVKNLGIKTVEAEESAFDRTLFALGEVEHTCESHSVLSSRAAGRIAEVLFHKGELVTKGDVIARVESRQAGNPPPMIELKAPASGLITDSQTHLGAPVEPDATLMEILDLSTVWITAKIPQNDASILNEGLTAKIRVPAIGNKELTAKFLRLGVDADAQKGSIDAVFALPNPNNELRLGMRAELTLIASQREAVLSIPREALQGDRSNRFVFIKDYEIANSFVRVPVLTGDQNHERVEITSGLYPGDEVVTHGAYALSFAGKGSASLKEALDAAHGHPHNEDGTEMTKEQIAAAKNSESHSHSHGALVTTLSITCALLFIAVLAMALIIRKHLKA
jgi:multidrug efflux pump subunit AcrA (membrane-fusion protein)